MRKKQIDGTIIRCNIIPSIPLINAAEIHIANEYSPDLKINALHIPYINLPINIDKIKDEYILNKLDLVFIKLKNIPENNPYAPSSIIIEYACVAVGILNKNIENNGLNTPTINPYNGPHIIPATYTGICIKDILFANSAKK